MNLQVADIGSFHIGGRRVTLSGQVAREVFYTDSATTPLSLDTNGDYHVEQMYVQYVRLVRRKARYPLWMMHGGRSTGVTWETTPDGRPGFQMYFLRQGHDVYISDAVERGRASWAPPEIWKSEPFFPTAASSWDLSRIGPPGSYATDPAKRRPYPATKYPVDSFDQQMKQRVPRWTTNSQATLKAYCECLDRIGACVLMAHSTGGPFALQLALRYPQLVKGLVLLEPAGARKVHSLELIAHIPHLYIWGDNTGDEPSLKETIPLARGWQEMARRAGAAVEWLELPQLGIKGNTHQLMMDTNSDEIAELIQQWMFKNDLMKSL